MRPEGPDVPGRERPADTTKHTLILLAIFIVVTLTHVLSPVINRCDSRWSIHTAMSIIAEGNTDLNEYEPILAAEDYYMIEEVGGKKYTMFPVGASLLAAPVVMVVDVYYRVVHGHSFQEYLAHHVPSGLEKFIASVMVALCAVMIYLIVDRRLKSPFRSLVIVFVFAFCTSAWSSASRALWQHAPSMLLLSIVLYLVVLAEERPKLIRLAGLPLAFSYVVRPINSIAILALSVLVLVRHRREFLWFVGWALVVAVPFVTFNWVVYGLVLSRYYTGASWVPTLDLLGGLAGTAISPGRGLFVFSPVLLFSLVGILLRLKDRRMDGLDVTLAVTLVVHWVFISSFRFWNIGHYFGPRYFCDVLPFFMWFLVPVMGRLRLPVTAGRAALAVVFVCLTSVSFYANFRGATHWSTWQWLVEPTNVNDHPERMWDWHDLQFLR